MSVTADDTRLNAAARAGAEAYLAHSDAVYVPWDAFDDRQRALAREVALAVINAWEAAGGSKPR